MKARLHGTGSNYSVIFEGKLLVERSRDPECDAARALLARGYTCTLHMLDGKTGIPAQSSTLNGLPVSRRRKALTVPDFVGSEVWRTRPQPRKRSR